jgi:hypothetical protein
MTELNKRIAGIPMPQRLAGFPLNDEGYPIPYFVPYVEGRPEFRAMDPEKFTHAIRHRKCWLCGGQLGKHLCFPIGPMCAITRTTAEPPSHLECAEYAVRACPFLTQPRMRRNEQDLPENIGNAGIAIKRNPGVTLLWTTLSYKLFSAGKGYLFRIGDPEHIEGYAQGRAALPSELAGSILTGYPTLESMAREEGPEAEEELAVYYSKGLKALGLRAEDMFIAERELASEDHRSRDGGTAGSEDAVDEVRSGGLGASEQPAPQPQRGPEVLEQQSGGGPGHTVQAGPNGQDGDPLEKPGGRRYGILQESARRIQERSERLAAGAMAVIGKIHRP